MLVFSISFGQDSKQGQILFSAEFVGNLEINDSSDNYLKSIVPTIKELSFELLFDNEGSYFAPIQFLQNDFDKNFEPALIIAGRHEYYNQSEKRCKKVELEDQIFLVEQTSLDWKITTETKKIKGFTCTRATAAIEIDNGQIIKSKNIEAWFTNEISCPFGPKGYYGLPGLILELKEGDILFRPEKISFETVDLPSFPEGEVISENDLNFLIQQIAKERFNIKD